MREELKNLVQEYLDNKALTEKVFAWKSSYLPPVCAGILLRAGRTFTKEEVENANHMIKHKTTFFSDYRGTAMPVMACALAAEAEPERVMGKSLVMYDELRKYFPASEYLPFGAMIMARLNWGFAYKDVCQKAKQLYDEMKKNHPFLTSKEDVSGAVLLAYSTKGVVEIGEEMEQCYAELKKCFSSSNDVQALSQVLTIADGTWQDKCARFMRVYEGLKAKGYKCGNTSRLPVLGALCVTDVSEEELIQDIIDIADALKGKKGYGFFGFGKADRLAHATMILSAYYSKQKENLSAQSASVTEAIDAVAAMAELNSVIAILAAQNAALICSVIAVSAANNS